mmetsp:Transcript_7310/g.10430  ORF Transcript_7310/g.10430 Transcript_7310/m.10430 type:complete len:378 (-) Transcript_7310:769-1902(-)
MQTSQDNLLSPKLPCCVRHFSKTLFCFTLFVCCVVFHHFFQGFNSSIKSTAFSNDHKSSQLWDSEGASACLLVKDAVNELPEWLAYHYHFLPLRYVIVAVDPTSVLNHTGVLSKFNRSLNEGKLTVIEWGEKDIQPEMKTVAVASNVSEMTYDQHKVHKKRQNKFISKCVETMKRLNRTWVFMHDVDEFVHVNKEATRMNHGGVGKFPPRSIVQAIENSGAPLPKKSDFCFPVPRCRFGAIDSPKSSFPDASLTMNGINIQKNRLLTHRFRHHARTGTFVHNLQVKSVVHASNFKGDLTNVYDPHVPFHDDGCNFKSYDDDYYLKSPLIIRHYTGTKVSHLSRPRGVGGVSVSSRLSKSKIPWDQSHVLYSKLTATP